jgi:hypothetical protein
MNWLQDILEDAVRDNLDPCLCCWRHGGRLFEQQIRAAAARSRGIECQSGGWSAPDIIALARALSELEWSSDPQHIHSRLRPSYLLLGARQLVYLIWQSMPADTLRRDINPILLPSPIGFLLQWRWDKAAQAEEEARIQGETHIRRAQKAGQNQTVHTERQAWSRERNDLDTQALRWVTSNADHFDQFLETSQAIAIPNAHSILPPDSSAWIIPMQSARWGELHVLCIRQNEKDGGGTFLAEVFQSRGLAERAIGKPRRASLRPRAPALATS